MASGIAAYGDRFHSERNEESKIPATTTLTILNPPLVTANGPRCQGLERRPADAVSMVRKADNHFGPFGRLRATWAWVLWPASEEWHRPYSSRLTARRHPFWVVSPCCYNHLVPCNLRILSINFVWRS